VGSAFRKRRITNLANGVDASDAATVDQLRSSSLIDADGHALSALTYSGPDYGLVSLAGIQGTRLTNLADGLVAVGSRDAINGGQLASLRDQLADRITGIDQRVETLEGDTEPAEPISRATARSFATATPPEAGGVDATVEADADAAVADATADAVAGSRVASARATPARVENVAAGEALTDAVNVSQLNTQRDEAIQMARSYTDERVDAVTQDMAGLRRDVQSRFQQVDRRIDRMAAMSGAYAGMAMNTAGLDGANRVGAGVGTQRGQKAIAVGYQHVIGKRASFSIGGAAGGSDRSVNAGAGFSW
jgi:autotransporter adhesin